MSASSTRLLIVDDIADNRIILSRRLVRRGFEVVEASGGRQALELIAQQSFDVVLLDIMMPDMDGFEFLKELRSRKLDIPVLVLTAKVLTREDTKFLNENGIRFLALKGDVDPGDLVRKIRTMTSQGAPLADKESLGEGTEK